MKKETKEMISFLNEKAKYHKIKPLYLLENYIVMSHQMIIVDKFENKRYEKYFGGFIQLLKNGIKQNPYFDFFGEVLMELNYYDKKTYGQCMSPPDISSLIAKLSLAYAKDFSDEVNFHEPTVGTGVFVLDNLKELLIETKKPVFIYANELDEILIRCCSIQLHLNLMIHNQNDFQRVFVRCYEGNILTDDLKLENIIYSRNIEEIHKDDFTKKEVRKILKQEQIEAKHKAA